MMDDRNWSWPHVWLVFVITSKYGISLQGGAEQVKKQNRTPPMSSHKNSSMKQRSWLLNPVKKCSSDSPERVFTQYAHDTVAIDPLRLL